MGKYFSVLPPTIFQKNLVDFIFEFLSLSLRTQSKHWQNSSPHLTTAHLITVQTCNGIEEVVVTTSPRNPSWSNVPTGI